jgi:DNA repair exonuclease SbcCD ATPase subunit
MATDDEIEELVNEVEELRKKYDKLWEEHGELNSQYEELDGTSKDRCKNQVVELKRLRNEKHHLMMQIEEERKKEAAYQNTYTKNAEVFSKQTMKKAEEDTKHKIGEVIKTAQKWKADYEAQMQKEAAAAATKAKTAISEAEAAATKAKTAISEADSVQFQANRIIGEAEEAAAKKEEEEKAMAKLGKRFRPNSAIEAEAGRFPELDTFDKNDEKQALAVADNTPADTKANNIDRHLISPGPLEEDLRVLLDYETRKGAVHIVE